MTKTRNSIIVSTTLLIAVFAFLYFFTGVFGGTRLNLTLQTNQNLEDGLIAHYTFDLGDMDTSNSSGEVLDHTGTQSAADWVDTDSEFNTVPGKIGQGIKFDGTNDYIDAGDLGSNVKTIAFWINTSSSTQDIMQLNVGGGGGGPDTPAYKDSDSDGFGASSAGNDPTVTVPASAVAGDYMVAIVVTDDNNPDISPTPPSNEAWTLQESGSMPIDGTAATSPVAAWLYTKVVSADDEANAGSKTYQWTFSGSEEQATLLLLYENIDSWGQFATNLLTGTQTTIDAPSVDTTSNNEMVIHAAFKDGGVAFSGTPGSGNLRVNGIWGSTNDSGGSLGVIDEVFPSYGTTGAKTYSLATNEANGFTFSLVPTSSGGGGGAVDISLSSGSLTSNGLISPTYYVDGVATNVLPMDGWHHVVLTMSTATTSGSVAIGKVSGYFNGTLDDVRFYNKELSANEVSRLHGLGATTHVNTSITTNPDLENGLALFLTFDGPQEDGIIDSSSHGNDGYLLPTGVDATSTKLRPGNIGQAFYFDGDDYIGALGAGSGISAGGALSVCAWVYPESFNLSGESVIIADSDSTSNNIQFGFAAGAAASTVTQNLEFFWANSGTTELHRSVGTISVEEWQHVCGIRVDVDTVKIYINGESQTVNSIFGDSIVSPTVHTVAIGRPGANPGGGYWNGMIDDLRVYERALSSEEIQRLYDLGATTHVNKTLATNPDLENGLVGHWTFDGPDMDTASSTAEVLDKSGNGYNADAQNFSSIQDALVPGVMGQAMTLNGSDQYATVQDTDDAFDPGTGDMTAAIWAKVSDQDQLSIPISKAYPIGSGGGWYMAICNQGNCTGSGQRFAIAYNQDTTHARQWSVVRDVADNKWHHFAFTVDGSAQEIVMYIDGEVQTNIQQNNNGSFPVVSNDREVRIGRGHTGGYYPGPLDDARYYNRVLSPEEIKRLYQLGR